MPQVKGGQATMSALLITVATCSINKRPKPNCLFLQWSKKPTQNQKPNSNEVKEIVLSRNTGRGKIRHNFKPKLHYLLNCRKRAWIFI